MDEQFVLNSKKSALVPPNRNMAGVSPLAMLITLRAVKFMFFQLPTIRFIPSVIERNCGSTVNRASSVTSLIP